VGSLNLSIPSLLFYVIKSVTLQRVKIDEKGTANWQPWMESYFLERMSTTAQRKVLNLWLLKP
jgi:hypothetical protein